MPILMKQKMESADLKERNIYGKFPDTNQLRNAQISSQLYNKLQLQLVLMPQIFNFIQKEFSQTVKLPSIMASYLLVTTLKKPTGK